MNKKPVGYNEIHPCQLDTRHAARIQGPCSCIRSLHFPLAWILVHFSPLLPLHLSGARTELLPFVSSTPHFWGVSDAFWHLDSGAVSWARETHWFGESTGRNCVWHVELHSWKWTGFYRKAPSRAGPSEKCSRLPGMEWDPLEEVRAIGTRENRLLSWPIKHWTRAPPWRLLDIAWAYSTSMCAGLFSMLGRSIWPI